MDPHLRWLRRFVLTRAAERVLVEAALLAVTAGVVAGLTGAGPAGAGALAISTAIVVAAARPALAIAFGPINHRYLLTWSDPSTRLRPAPRRPTGDDRDPERLGLRFVIRLEQTETETETGTGTGGGGPGLDIYQTRGAGPLVTLSDAGEATALSRLADGRALVTSVGFIPPVRMLVVERADTAGREPVEAVLRAHGDRLRQLRGLGIEPVGTEPRAVLALVRTEWAAWEQLGPIVGPLVAVGSPSRFRFGLQVDIPADLVRQRTTSLGRRLGQGPPTADRRPATGPGQPLVRGPSAGGLQG